jgi:type III restriction enzyme
MTFELLGFQTRAVRAVLSAVKSHEPSRYLAAGLTSYDIEDGEPLPYVHRLKAVTGAGKTPILAAIAGELGDAIVLWTTPSAAVIKQTVAALRGKYRSLLPADTQICDLSETTDADWGSALDTHSGLSILVATVGSFNQSGDTLRLHKGSPSRWEELRIRAKGGRRQRRLFVLYDEGHNSTSAQLSRIATLRPYALVLAGASPLPGDLLDLLPGGSRTKKEEYLAQRTTLVSTKTVVKANLLKRGLHLASCHQPWQDILRAACDTRAKLEAVSSATQPSPIMCSIVNRTDGAIDVWMELLRIGVPAHKIAVHVTKATQVAQQVPGANVSALHDTYARGMDPDAIRAAGYTHIIWNKALKEGWDEPWAYVAYFHDTLTSSTDIEQKVGRFLRNPFRGADDKPALPPSADLAKSYYYFNGTNKHVSRLLRALKATFKMSGHAVSAQKDLRDPTSTPSPVRRQMTIPKLAIWPDEDSATMRTDLLKAIITPDDASRASKGRVMTVQFDLFTTVAGKHSAGTLGGNTVSTSGELIRRTLASVDRRITSGSGSEGGWLDASIWDDPKMKVSVNHESAASKHYEDVAKQFAAGVDEYIHLDYDPGEVYTVPEFRMVRANQGTTDLAKARYKVRSFTHSIHPQYNGLNAGELAVARALDSLGWPWARNPVSGGYGIPLLLPSGSSTIFYPDFVVWRNDGIVFVDPKGSHILRDAIRGKLFELPEGMRVVFVVADADGVRYIYRKNRKVKVRRYLSAMAALQEKLGTNPDVMK